MRCQGRNTPGRSDISLATADNANATSARHSRNPASCCTQGNTNQHNDPSLLSASVKRGGLRTSAKKTAPLPKEAAPQQQTFAQAPICPGRTLRVPGARALFSPKPNGYVKLHPGCMQKPSFQSSELLNTKLVRMSHTSTPLGSLKVTKPKPRCLRADSKQKPRKTESRKLRQRTDQPLGLSIHHDLSHQG